MNDNKPILTICCITYNHESYIRATIEGFLIQKTNFLFDIIIHDDASTDKTAEIVKEYADKYPNLIAAIFQTENKFSKGVSISATYVWPRVRGKYIAICEGDDYWTDPYKLQKQVDFLEANKDFGLVHTDLDQYDTVKVNWIRGLWKNCNKNKTSGEIYDLLMCDDKHAIYLCTACFRSQFIKQKEYEDVIEKKFMYGDVPLYLHIARQSKIGYLPESSAVRNVLRYSATQGRNFEYMLDFTKTALSIFEYFNKLRPVSIDPEIVYRAHKLKELDVCFRYQRRNEFNVIFKSLKKSERNCKVYIQKVGLYNQYILFLSRALLNLSTKLISFGCLR